MSCQIYGYTVGLGPELPHSTIAKCVDTTTSNSRCSPDEKIAESVYLRRESRLNQRCRVHLFDDGGPHQAMTAEKTGTFINGRLEKPICAPEVDGPALPLRAVDSAIATGPLSELWLSHRAHRDNPEVHKLNNLVRITMAVRPAMLLMKSIDHLPQGLLPHRPLGTLHGEFVRLPDTAGFNLTE